MGEESNLASLRREVVALRQRVAELQRRAAQFRPDESQEFVTASDRVELLRETERMTHTGTWVWDVDNDTVYWSDQLFEILGYDPDVDEATTEKYFARVHPDDLDYALEVARESAASGITRFVDYRLLLPDGEVRWVSITGSILFDDSGTLRRIVGTVRDTTEERSGAIALTEAHRLEAVGELAGGVAHEFRNLLMVIRTQLELLDDVEDSARATIDSAVNSASSITAQLLAFGQQATLRPQRTDLNEVVRRTASLVRPLLDSHELQLDLSNEPLTCRLDGAHFEEALTNLLLHARDGMPDGGVIRMSTHGDRHEVLLTIDNDGTRYAADERLFEPFFHATAGRVDLRMAMAHGIVVQHGGCIAVEPSPQGGRRFVLGFRAVATDETVAKPTTPAPGNRTILVVDDQAPVARVVSRLLESEGHTVLLAEDGFAALEVYAMHADQIDVVLTDLAMPGMLGTELVAQLESRWSVPNVIFMSGYAAEAEREINERYPLLHKPFTRDQLLHVLNKLEREDL